MTLRWNGSKIAWATLPIVGVFLLWELLTRTGLLNAVIFPAPTTIAFTALQLFRTGELPSAIGATLYRALSGFALGSILGVAMGLLMGGVETVGRVFNPIISSLNSAPKLTLLPMLVLFLGVGDAPRIFLVALGTVVILAMHGADAVRAVQPAYLELARNNGARGAVLFREVYLPATLPRLFTGFRLALGRAVVVTVSAELLGAREGLGNMIFMGWQTFAVEKLFTGVIVTMALGGILQGAILLLELWLVPWRRH